MRRSDIADMEGHIAAEEDYYPDGQMDGEIIQVPSITVRQFTSKYNVPKYFGVLSIDAEGTGNQVWYYSVYIYMFFFKKVLFINFGGKIG